jgi:hypothetical protein
MEFIHRFCFDLVDNDGKAVDGPPSLKVFGPASLAQGCVERPDTIDWSRRIELWTMESGIGSTRRVDEKYLIQEGATLQIEESDSHGQVIKEHYLSIPVRPKDRVAPVQL